MKYTSLLIFVLFLFACNNNSETDNPKQKAEDASAHNHDHSEHNHDGHNHDGHNHAPTSTQTAKTTMGDYSQAFLQKLMTEGGQRDVLINGDRIIFAGKDTVQFPQEPAIGAPIKVNGKNKEFRISGMIKRMNYTTVEFNLSIEDASQNKCTYAGTADLGIGFYLGSESNTDESTGISYFATEFTAQNKACQSLSLRIGKPDEQAEAKYLVKLLADCSDDCAAVDLDNGPTLRQE